MKKLLAVVLIALLVGSFSACKQIDQPTTTTTEKTPHETSTESTTITPQLTTNTPFIVKVNESALHSGPIWEVTDPATGYYFIGIGENYYFLYDVDGDGTKELLLAENRDHSGGQNLFLGGICTIAIQLDNRMIL